MRNVSGLVAGMKSLPVGIAVLEPDGTIAERNAAWGGHVDGDARSSDDDAPNYFDMCTPAEIGKLREVIDGRCPVFTSIQSFDSAVGPVLQVALPHDLVPPSGLVVLHLDLANLLPADIAGAILRESRLPEPGAIGLDLIVRTIEQTIAKTMTGPAGSGSANGEDGEDPAASEEKRRVLAALSPRQCEVLALMGAGNSNTEIADDLGISMNTTKLHVAAILRRLRLDNRLQAVALGSRVYDQRRRGRAVGS